MNIKKLPRERQNFLVGFTFIILTIFFIQFGSFINLDRQLELLIYNYFSSRIMTFFFDFITLLGGFFGALIVLALTIFHKRYKSMTYFLFSYSSLIIIRFFLQLIIVRPRPFEIVKNHPYLGTVIPYGSSFPSFHAASAFFLAFFLSTIFKLKPLPTIFLYLLAVLIAVSRVYLGAHYPLDVLAGGFLGLLWGYISFHSFRNYFKR